MGGLTFASLSCVPDRALGTISTGVHRDTAEKEFNTDSILKVKGGPGTDVS
jgi:hypothetical protein